MDTKNLPAKSKLTIRIWTPILDALNQRTDEAFLRRDSLISRALEVELPRIKVQLPHRNSTKARRYIEARLRTLFSSGQGAQQISLALDPQVAKQLEQICQDLNVPRETLLNRLFMLLGSPGKFLSEHFSHFTPQPLSAEEFPTAINLINDVRNLASDLTRFDESSADYDLALSPLGRMVSIANDPLKWYYLMLDLRYQQVIEYVTASGDTKIVEEITAERHRFTPFGMTFDGDEELDGLNCYLDEEYVESIGRDKRAKQTV